MLHSSIELERSSRSTAAARSSTCAATGADAADGSDVEAVLDWRLVGVMA